MTTPDTNPPQLLTLSNNTWVQDKYALIAGIVLGLGSGGMLLFNAGYIILTCFIALVSGYYLVKGIQIKARYLQLSTTVATLLFINLCAFILIALLVPRPLGVTILAIGLHITAILISIRLMLAIKNNASSQPVEVLPHTVTNPLPKVEELNTPTHTIPAYPLSVEKDANYLVLLISPHAQQLLKKLINVINNLNNSQAYLRNHYSYLADAVNLLIEDLTTNTIHRLNLLAQPFVQEDKIDELAQKVFLERHNQGITDLLQQNLEQIEALNQSILDKQMAEFERIGTATEQAFRNSLMEIKILIRQLIASHYDKQHINSHQILFKNIEENTVIDMEKNFFDSNTTHSQQEQLYQQLIELIEYLKNINPTSSQLISYSTNNILQLPSVISSQGDTQKFIEWNYQYIQQLKQHWR